MNSKKYASKIKSLLEKELTHSNPPLLLDNGVMLYKTFKIKMNKKGEWQLLKQCGLKVYDFKLKLSALIAAEYYDRSLFKHLKELIVLDREYFNNITDHSIYNHQIKLSKQIDKIDILIARADVSKLRARIIKKEIMQRFETNFA
jgi:hypothetical protein